MWSCNLTSDSHLLGRPDDAASPHGSYVGTASGVSLQHHRHTDLTACGDAPAHSLAFAAPYTTPAKRER